MNGVLHIHPGPTGQGGWGWLLTQGFAALHLWAILLIRQEKSGIVSHPFPQKTPEWMGHPRHPPVERNPADVE